MGRFTTSPGKPLILLFVLLMGCNRAAVGKADKTYDKLSQIGEAYMSATDKLNRAPAKIDDLRPHLENFGEVAEILRSDNDGEEFVILWGVDHRIHQPYPVTAYEKAGKNGKRYVLRVRHVIEMTDEELSKAPFPAGHKAPI